MEQSEWDYIVVGSGAGGGTLAARLAEEGMRVFLLEAGSDYASQRFARLPDDYEIPAFHPFASENAELSWNFFVRHYADEKRQARDPKYRPQGVLYPRGATLGGSTAHNAMIFVYPHDSDWNGIAKSTGDSSWRAWRMRRYAKRLENCQHRPIWRRLRLLGLDATGHGWNGWLRTEHPILLQAIADDALVNLMIDSIDGAISKLPHSLRRILKWLRSYGDPNARSFGRRSFEGACYTPVSTSNRARNGARERILDVQRRYPDRLHIEFNALATRVLLDEHATAIGVEYLKGERLYRAHAAPTPTEGERREVRARREVILAGGAFNSPQLLMLSGIGPAEELNKHKIPVRVDLPGVGKNLQDRYEVSVTSRMRRRWHVLERARFEGTDPLATEWREGRCGMYSSNGAAIAVVQRSQTAKTDPDLFCMAMLAHFDGYFPGYSAQVAKDHDVLSWTILKAHTRNNAGVVKLRSTDPRDPPEINFHYFEEGSDSSGQDLRAVVDGVNFARSMTKPLERDGFLLEEILPGKKVQSESQLLDYVRDHAWGHHASCTCAIGPRDQDGVLGSDFSVHGVRRLRVVDASVFPKIPGFFIASAVYMLGEKAADVILRDARRQKLQAAA